MNERTVNRQTGFTVQYWRLLYPKVHNIGTPAFRRMVAKLLPSARLQRLRSIIETSDAQARNIYNDKKAALLRGDNSIKHQVGEGKDIISILRECASPSLLFHN